MKVNNLPKKLKKYVVARGYQGQFWFWGTWDDEIDAYNVSEEVKGLLLLSSELEVA